MRSTDSWPTKNVRLGLRVGIGTATLFSAWVTMVRLAVGPHAFDHFGLTWSELVVLYYGSLLLGGWLYGLAEPLRKRSVWGAILQGMLLLLPFYTGATLAVGLAVDRDSGFATYTVAGLLIGLIGGTAFGLRAWFKDQEVSGD